MRIIDRYVIREVLWPFVIGLLGFAFLLIIPFLIRLAEALIAKGVSGMVIVQLMVMLLPGGDGGEPAQHVEFASLPADIHIAATLEPHAYGTEIHMYVRGVRSGTLCQVFLRGPRGERVSAGTFRYRYGEDSNAVLSAALDISETRAIGVRAGNRTFTAPVDSKGPAALDNRKQEGTT